MGSNNGPYSWNKCPNTRIVRRTMYGRRSTIKQLVRESFAKKSNQLMIAKSKQSLFKRQRMKWWVRNENSSKISIWVFRQKHFFLRKMILNSNFSSLLPVICRFFSWRVFKFKLTRSRYFGGFILLALFFREAT